MHFVIWKFLYNLGGYRQGFIGLYICGKDGGTRLFIRFRYVWLTVLMVLVAEYSQVKVELSEWYLEYLEQKHRIPLTQI